MSSRRNGIMATLIIVPIVAVIIVAIVSRVAGTQNQRAAATATPGKTTHHLFVTSATENEVPNLITFPLHQGTSNGRTVYYVITESSDKADAMARGVNFSSKLANAKGTPAVQVVQVNDGVIDFPATVNFTPSTARVLVPSDTGFPPTRASPPAVGEDGYSPLIQLPSGIVLNAPQIANDTGKADKVASLDLEDMKVTYHETMGFYEDKQVHYVSFESSSPVAAAIEDVTYAPALGMAPGEDNEDPNVSSREELIAFINGPTGATNPNRQGLNSTLLDGMDPLNLLHKAPQDVPDYSPLWDVHFVAWTDTAIKQGLNTRQIDFEDAKALIAKGLVTGVSGPDGKTFGPAGFIVTCPIMSVDIGPGQSL